MVITQFHNQFCAYFYIQIRIWEYCSAANEDSGFLGCCYSW